MPGFDLEEIDWKNPDVNKLFEVLTEKFDQMDKQMKDLQKDNQLKDVESKQVIAENKQVIAENKQVITENKQLKEEIVQLKKLIAKLQKKKTRSSHVSSYNTREYKGYPEIKKQKTQPKYTQQDHETTDVIVDHKFCPSCGNPLADSSSKYTRNGESIIDGKWSGVNMTIVGRYCKKCARMQYAKPIDFMPEEHFSITIMARISAMRNLTISYGKIQKLLQMFYGKNIAISTLEKLDARVSKCLEPVYYSLLDEIVKAKILGGDETGWYLNGKLCWAWVFHSIYTVVYHISQSRSKMVSETFLKDFEGILMGDSHPGWSVADILQKCLLHYFRDMYRTLEKNDKKEFQSFFDELYKILKSAIKLGKKHDTVQDIAKGSITKLQKRINALATGTYEDTDCLRYVKRLKREGNSLLTFLKYDGVPYHNNASEQAMRIFAIMRKIFYGSRSERGLKTTEIRQSIFATCERRDVNPYHFVKEYLRGNIKEIPMPKVTVAA